MLLLARHGTARLNIRALPLIANKYATTTNNAVELRGKRMPPIRMSGLDEAGRGAVLGPIVIGVVIATPSIAEYFISKGVKDSKMLSTKKREELYDVITESSLAYSSLHTTANEIDKRRNAGESLNLIESNDMIEALHNVDLSDSPYSIIRDAIAKKTKKYHPFNRLFIDAIDNDAHRFSLPFRTEFPEARIVCCHKADEQFAVVAAASIVAKVERDRAMTHLSKQIGVALGSGYPADPKTKAYLLDLLRRNEEFPEFVRMTWSLKALKKELAKSKAKIANKS